MWRRAPGFFDVVTYNGAATGTNQSIVEIPHNLGVVPELKWVKVRNEAFGWVVGGDVVRQIRNPDAPLGEDNVVGWGSWLALDTDAKVQHNQGFWPSEDTEEYLYHNASNAYQGGAAYDYVTYLFASVPGVCDIGTYTGNGTTLDIDCGFTNGARWFMIKRTDQNGDWYFTSMPGSPEVLLKFNKTDGQMNYSSSFTVPQGFRVRSTLGDLNVDGDTYIYMAIA